MSTMVKRDLGRINSHENSLDRVHTIMTGLEDNVASLLSGGTTNTSQIHHVDAVATANVANLAAFTVAHDGLTMTAGQRILLTAQSTGAENGIYVLGTVATTAPLTRATDWDASVEVKSGSIVAVRAGTAGAGTIWQLSNATAVVVGTTAQTFAQIYTVAQMNTALATTVAYAAAANAAILAKKTVTVAETELTGASTVINVGTALPTNAVVVAHEIVVNTQGVLAGNDLTITLGGTDADAIVASTDLDALAPGSYQCTLGAHPRGKFSAEQLVATFAAGDLASLSAGNWTINVWYHVLA